MVQLFRGDGLRMSAGRGRPRSGGPVQNRSGAGRQQEELLAVSRGDGRTMGALIVLSPTFRPAVKSLLLTQPSTQGGRLNLSCFPGLAVWLPDSGQAASSHVAIVEPISANLIFSWLLSPAAVLSVATTPG